MLDLFDGETVEVQGSASRPYLLKNLGGVYSCSCPAWRNQSLPIERRTCKHLRQLRGDDVEAERVGSQLPSIPTKNAKLSQFVPPLLLAENWNDSIDPTGWWLSEKLDGVRAYWDGKQFLSRQGHRYHAPDWFTAGLPLEPLDGELWIGRKLFQRTVSVVRRQDQTGLWRMVRFRVFDAPAHEGDFESRIRMVNFIMEYNQPQFASAHLHVRCEGPTHLREELARIEAMGGEGLMLRMPGSRYEHCRSSTLLKVKTFHEAEATVIAHERGTGRHKGRLGAVLAEMADGTRFAVGTGFTDAERSSPPTIGSTITFRYQELTEAGVPRFPTFVRIRGDMAPRKGEPSLSNKTASTRRFEFVEGSSDKFWEIAVNGSQVTVCFGRNGTAGQRDTKTFADAADAQKHADKKIVEKLGKGYSEVGKAA
jgi:DNA ligase-1